MSQYEGDDFEEFEGDLEVPDNLNELIVQTFKVGNLTITIQQAQLAKYVSLGVYHDAMRLIHRLSAEKVNCERAVARHMDEGNYRKVATLAERFSDLDDQMEALVGTNEELRLTLKQLSWID